MQRPEHVFQLLPSAVNVPAHRTHGQIQEIGNVFVRPPLDLSQHEAQPLLFSQPSQGLLERRGERTRVQGGRRGVARRPPGAQSP